MFALQALPGRANTGAASWATARPSFCTRNWSLRARVDVGRGVTLRALTTYHKRARPRRARMGFDPVLFEPRWAKHMHAYRRCLPLFLSRQIIKFPIVMHELGRAGSWALLSVNHRLVCSLSPTVFADARTCSNLGRLPSRLVTGVLKM